MAVTWENLKAPAGQINATQMFGDEDEGEERLTAYLADGAIVGAELSGDDLDAFLTHHAYFRAYRAKYELELDKAAQKQLVNQGSASKLEKQITGWLDLANAEKALADALIPPDVDDVLETTIPPTMSTPVTYGW